MKAMLNLFLSYSHLDRPSAARLHGWLEADGAECWFDTDNLRAGQDFPREIAQAIRAADGLVLLLSKESNASDFVWREVALAHYLGKPIFPVRLDQTEISDGLLLYLIRSQYVQFDRMSVKGLGDWLPKGRAPERPAAAEPDGAARWVTWAEFEPFMRAASLPGLAPGKSYERVTGVSWDEAAAFCDWAGGQLPASPGGDSADDSGASLEWRDGGTELYKHVVDSATLNVVGINRKDVRAAGVGFRRADIGPAPGLVWVRAGGGDYQLGTDAPEFSRLADAFRLPGHLSAPVLRRAKQPQHVPGFEIASRCVTNEEYFAFTQSGQPFPKHWDAKWRKYGGAPFPASLRHKPVTNVTLAQAQAYCRWAGVRLPTWKEWQCAAAGGARRYPWGDDYDQRRCNSQESGRGSLARADDFAAGDTPGGLRQLCGNVFEWTIGPGGAGELAGGSYRVPCQLWGLACAFRRPEPDYSAPDAGFRAARG